MRKFISHWLSFFILFLLENVCRKKKLRHKVLVILASKIKCETKSPFCAAWQCFELSQFLMRPLSLIDCCMSFVWPVCFVEKAVASSLWTAKLMFGMVSSSNFWSLAATLLTNKEGLQCTSKDDVKIVCTVLAPCDREQRTIPLWVGWAPLQCSAADC